MRTLASRGLKRLSPTSLLPVRPPGSPGAGSEAHSRVYRGCPSPAPLYCADGSEHIIVDQRDAGGHAGPARRDPGRSGPPLCATAAQCRGPPLLRPTARPPLDFGQQLEQPSDDHADDEGLQVVLPYGAEDHSNGLRTPLEGSTDSTHRGNRPLHAQPNSHSSLPKTRTIRV
eukprot:scaffold1001_cov72-Phaeocystis_antarctica.AAC.4